MSGQLHHLATLHPRKEHEVYFREGRKGCMPSTTAPRSAHGGFRREMLYVRSIYLFIHTKFIFISCEKNACIFTRRAFHLLVSACNLISSLSLPLSLSLYIYTHTHICHKIKGNLLLLLLAVVLAVVVVVVVVEVHDLLLCILKLKTKLRGFSPRANHTDRAAAAGRRS